MRLFDNSSGKGLDYYRVLWEAFPPVINDTTIRTSDPLIVFDRDDAICKALNLLKIRTILIKPSPIFAVHEENVFALDYRDGEGYDRLVAILQERNINFENVIYLWGYDDSDADGAQPGRDRSTDDVCAILSLTNALLRQNKQQAHLLYLYQAEPGRSLPFKSAVSGLLKSICSENPDFRFRSICCDREKNRTDELLNVIRRELCLPDAADIKYAGEARYAQRLREMSQNERRPLPLKVGGVYVICDEAGFNGPGLAHYLNQHYDATAVVIRRFEESAGGDVNIVSLPDSGRRVYYIQIDFGEDAGLQKAINITRRRFGPVKGVIHVADPGEKVPVRERNPKAFEETVRRKLSEIVDLDRATSEEPLDFFVMFSSLSSLTGFSGYSDYAVVNRFKNEFAVYRDRLAVQGQRSGNTITVDWPFSVVLNRRDDSISEYPAGDVPLDLNLPQIAESIRAFEIIVSGSARNVVVFRRSERREVPPESLQNAGSRERTPEAGSVPPVPVADPDLLEKAVAYLKTILSEETKLPIDRIHSRAPLESFGIDSLMILNLFRKMEESFGQTLPRSLFFDYANLHDVARYFAKNHSGAVRWLGSGSIAPRTANQAPAVDPAEKGHPQASVVMRGGNEDNTIAIIGVSGRYPMADTLDDYWENLVQGKDCVSEIPPERWRHDAYFGGDTPRNGKTPCKWGGFLRNVDRFDADFFGITRQEAEMMDPQQRLFLEISWQCIEDAGYTPDGLRQATDGRIGVFVGSTWQEYMLYKVDAPGLEVDFHPSAQICHISNRVSHHLGFSGPSIAVDTASSSSLTALHLAYRSVRDGECPAALAGGVNISIHPNKYQIASFYKMVSAQGRCRSFGEGGDGYVPGEGVGAVLLKPLKQALRDGDFIYAVIRASAINHNGKTNGYAMPSPGARQNLITDALKSGAIEPESIGYIEAHGIGTLLSDSIEIESLNKAFRTFTQRRQFCAIGSAKSNIGHLEAAAGISQVTKVLLQMKHNVLVPSLHARPANPHIAFTDTAFKVQEEATTWQRRTGTPGAGNRPVPRRAGITSFGAAGANAHVILEDWPDPDDLPADGSRSRWIIVLSAKDASRLKVYAGRLAVFLRNHGIPVQPPAPLQRGSSTEVRYKKGRLPVPELPHMDRIAYTLQTGRVAMKCRLAIVVASADELHQKIVAYQEGHTGIAGVFSDGDAGDAPQFPKPVPDSPGGEIIEKLVREEQYGQLAQLWASGVDFNWRLFYPGVVPRRVSLPVYPFRGDRYWVSREIHHYKKARQTT